MPTRNKLSLVFSACITGLFIMAGILDILDYLIVKGILFSAFTLLAVHLIIIFLKDTNTE